MEFLIDTSAISELIKERPDPGVVAWFESVDETQLYLSVLTLGEIYKGISKIKDDKRAAKLERWVSQDLSTRFNGRIVPIDPLITERWGRLVGEKERTGEKIPVIDALIGATGLVLDLAVVTRNVKDIARTGVRVVSPWSE
jgi:predicted nucleic acid-binding protein